MRSLNLLGIFPALTVKNYRIFWLSQWIALMGLWMQLTAQQWMVYTMTDSALLLGLLSAMQYLPSLLFSLWAGYFIDRYVKRHVLIGTQTMYMLQAFLLGLLVYTGYQSYGWILFFAFFLGTIDCVDMPARYAFLPMLVSKEYLKSATSLNSTNFNITRMIGPILAAFLLSFLSYDDVFFLDAACLLPILYAYIRMKVPPEPPFEKKGSVLSEIKEGVGYTLTHATILSHLLSVAVVSGLILNFGCYGPPFADRVLHAGLAGFSRILFSVGAGSMLGGLLSAVGTKRPSQNAAFYAGLLCGACLIAVSQMTQELPSYLLFAGIGFTAITSVVNSNTIIQIATERRFLGRVMSLYTLVFLGATPFGSVIASSIIEFSGTSQGLLAIGLLDMTFLLLIRFFYWRGERQEL